MPRPAHKTMENRQLPTRVLTQGRRAGVSTPDLIIYPSMDRSRWAPRRLCQVTRAMRCKPHIILMELKYALYTCTHAEFPDAIAQHGVLAASLGQGIHPKAQLGGPDEQWRGRDQCHCLLQG